MVDSTRGYLGDDPALQMNPVVPTERVVARVRRHGRVLILPALFLILIAGLSAYGVGLYPEGWEMWSILGGAVVAFLLLVLWPFMNWLNRRTTITTRRVIVRKGFFVRERREIFHSRGYEITVRRGALQALTGSATILLTSGVERPLVIKSVPGATLIVDTLHHLIEKNQVLIGGTSALGATGLMAPPRR
ncbi:PH domain-containing protein [Mycetocola spongiae]|uniref:PH domain-containing protein n=1 Tax=Mycetocola spongiae TaxID=2859226 RepID=UPI001CF17375|nr:PH domain-containing protein [Mycetocola spongiae]UCR90355.1 PH domain-containing protein [Mycetocola spongiae]